MSDAPVDPHFAQRLLRWFDVSGRHDLPWQHPRSAYRVWLSEIMLQQTQVATVIPYFERFLRALPDLPALAAAPQDQVLALWSGLGYYARARNLHAAAKVCVERHGGVLPHDVEALAELPGIGRSTAAAIASQAFGAPEAILDGNVKRVLARYYGVAGWPNLPAIERRLWAYAAAHVREAALPAERMPDYTQAQMDLGATVCTRARPACLVCPLQDGCVARREGLTDALPTPRPTRQLPQREARLVWLEDTDGRVLLQKRPPTGVWASLWSLPQFDDMAQATAWRGDMLADTREGEVLAPVQHGFSHYGLTLHPLRWRGIAAAGARVRDDDSLQWYDRAQLDALGIPAPIRKLLQAGESP